MDFQRWMSRFGSEIVLLEVNYFKTAGGECTPLHTHPGQLHIACFEQGTGVCSINGIARKIRPGMVLFVYPGERHEFVSGPARPYRACFLHFTWYGELPVDFPKELQLPHAARSGFFRHCRELAECCHRGLGQSGGVFFLYSHLLRFFGELQRLGNICTASDSLQKQGIDKALNPVISALFGPPFAYPGIDVLAEKAGMSRRTLTRLFRQHTGCGIKQYFLANVMRYAHFMMQSGGYGSAQIARQCGYSSTQNFLLAYRNYRKNHLHDLNSPQVIFWKPEKSETGPK